MSIADVIQSVLLGSQAVNNLSKTLQNATTLSIPLAAGTSGYAFVFSNNVGTTGCNGVEIQAGANSTTDSSTIVLAFATPTGIIVGNVARNGSGTVAYNTSSDQTLKDVLGKGQNGLAIIKKIDVVDFSWKGHPDVVHRGCIAQQVYEVIPEAVLPGVEGRYNWSMDYGRLTPNIILAVQELAEIVKKQGEVIEELKCLLDRQ